jgi:hypothetical protein
MLTARQAWRPAGPPSSIIEKKVWMGFGSFAALSPLSSLYSLKRHCIASFFENPVSSFDGRAKLVATTVAQPRAQRYAGRRSDREQLATAMRRASKNNEEIPWIFRFRNVSAIGAIASSLS